MDVIGFGGGFGMGLPPAVGSLQTVVELGVGFSTPVYTLDIIFLGGWGLLNFREDVGVVSPVSVACRETTQEQWNNTCVVGLNQLAGTCV